MGTPQIGEQFVGAYHKLVTECEIVSYNQRSRRQGDQMEVDLIAIDSRAGSRTVYACEVVTHLRGMRYSGTPSTDRWQRYGSEMYQNTLEKLLRKFESDHGYVTGVFGDADDYVFQLWSPVVPEGNLTAGLEEVGETFEERTGYPLKRIINEDYAERIAELKELAEDDPKQYGEPAFRFLQIIEHMRK